jgi:hypothetical protein
MQCQAPQWNAVGVIVIDLTVTIGAHHFELVIFLGHKSQCHDKIAQRFEDFQNLIFSRIWVFYFRYGVEPRRYSRAGGLLIQDRDTKRQGLGTEF